MMKYSRKNGLKQAEMQGNEMQNRSRESETSKMPVRQDRIIKTQSQSGRSMVEMLGVLAIIGVLSIGGITGYKYAMNYYQANQIAHEMNIMRTDAKIKIAQGADELILGNPYDDGNINFNNYETDFDCALADDAIIEENVSCRVANAFYIEMKNISQEICRPLSKLIQGMSELIGFEITTETIEADNEECQEGANNIHAVFSAEAISELKSCKETTDCEEFENTPYCDKTRHVCVECLNNQNCIEKDTNNPVCNLDTNTCEPCPPKSLWYVNDGKCHAYECRSNEDCPVGKFCMTTVGYQNCEEFSPDPNASTFSGKCVDVNSEKGYLPTAKFYYSEHNMTWWSAERFCNALKKPMATRSLLGCDGYSDKYCTESDIEEKIVNDLKNTGKLGDPQTHFWLEKIGECHAYHACYENKWIRYNSNTSDTYIQALCKE